MAEVLESLCGRWRGSGVGSYPTVPEFSYAEELDFATDGRPFLHLSQVTRRRDGTPLHVEQGYLRTPSDKRVELVIAQPTGVVEVLEGIYGGSGDSLLIDATSTLVGLTSSAKAVGATRRRFELTGDLLHVEFWMSASGYHDERHLESWLRRGDDTT